jgi:DNA-binding transcriptional LysR family regulator
MADLNALAVFAKVVEAGSFSEAARRLKMPISTVSRRIAELEDQLGVHLIERSTRNLRLTELGAEVLEHAIRSAELSEAVESIVSNRLTDVSGTLRLSSMPSVSDTLTTPLVTAFQASYPNVRVQILVTERMVDLIAEGIDLAFRLGALKDSSLIARRILTYRHQLVASPSYLKDRELPRKPCPTRSHVSAARAFLALRASAQVALFVSYCCQTRHLSCASNEVLWRHLHARLAEPPPGERATGDAA